MTYTERKGKKPFDWDDFLSQTTISEKAWRLATERAIQWVTCAVGNQCDVIPRYWNGTPKDDELLGLGGSFFMAIDQRNISMAKKFLMQIEERAAELIFQINNQRL